jgi:phosphomannomutase
LSSLEALINRAKEWLSVDPDPETRTETERLLKEALDTQDQTVLSAQFNGRLHFGTAGLRGAIGAGPQRMNTALIRLVSLGISDYLSLDTEGRKGRIVIGYDGRHKSHQFAQEAALCFSHQGFEVELATGLCPTPTLAFAVCHREAIAGVMVTASHNPPQDNGFKVYWGNGAQIIPPQDVEISTAIDEVSWSRVGNLALDAVRESERGAIKTLDLSPNGMIGVQYRSLLNHQLSSIAVEESSASLKMVYTAMHGVGTEWFSELVRHMPQVQFIPVLEQVEPDPDFPTVNFPNPEERGALDLARKYAHEHQADLILAHDPDADRLAVVARNTSGEMQVFTGDQIGALIAHEIFTTRALSSNDMVATTIVSSSLLATMASRVGVQYAETLTGFKWIANRALTHQTEGGRFLFGYEEAIGYSLFGLVNDKDGLSAGCFLLQMALRAKRDGLTLWDRLSDIYKLDGLYLSSLVSRVRQGAEGEQQIAQWMSTLRQTPLQSLGGVDVTEITDFSLSPPPLTGNVLRYRLTDGSRVIVRPSGTEPKLKLYFETCTLVNDEDDLEKLKILGEQRLGEMSDAFLALLDSSSST